MDNINKMKENKEEQTEVKSETVNTEEVKEKSLFQRHITPDGKMNFTTCINEVEAQIKTLQHSIKLLNEGMAYFINYCEEQENKKKIIIPDSNGFIGSTKL